MGGNLPEWQTKWLTYLVFILLTILTGFTMYQNSSIAEMQERVNELPKEYVQLERYTADQSRQESTLDKIDRKLDSLIMEGRKK